MTRALIGHTGFVGSDLDRQCSFDARFKSRNIETMPVTIRGLSGDDALIAGEHDDVVFGGSGGDNVFGKGGDDTLFGGSGDDTLEVGDGRDVLGGGAGNDTVSGGSGNDLLYGGAGNDTLAGERGSDVIYGGNGDDLVYLGIDDGGDGVADIYAVTADNGFDIVHDFEPGFDMIDLSVTGIASFEELRSGLVQRNVGTRIDVDGVPTVGLDGIDLETLSANNFIF